LIIGIRFCWKHPFMSIQEPTSNIVDSADLNTIALVPGRTIILMNKTIKLIELSFILSLFIFFLYCSSNLIHLGGIVGYCNPLIEANSRHVLD
jgi:hypothetical protein